MKTKKIPVSFSLLLLGELLKILIGVIKENFFLLAGPVQVDGVLQRAGEPQGLPEPNDENQKDIYFITGEIPSRRSSSVTEPSTLRGDALREILGADQ